MVNKRSHRVLNSLLHRRWTRLIALALLLLAMLLSPAAAQEPGAVYVMTFDGPVNPLLLSYIERGIQQAADRDAEKEGGHEAAEREADVPEFPPGWRVVLAADLDGDGAEDERTE